MAAEKRDYYEVLAYLRTYKRQIMMPTGSCDENHPTGTITRQKKNSEISEAYILQMTKTAAIRHAYTMFDQLYIRKIYFAEQTSYHLRRRL